jgi:hypothetical protein
MKGAERYFADWLAYHRARGFGHIVVAVDEPPGFDFASSCYGGADECGLVTKASGSRQIEEFNAYLISRRGTGGYVVFLDDDEYLDFDCAVLEAFIAERPFTVLKMPQVVYIADGDKYRWKYDTAPVSERFTSRSCCGLYQYGKVCVKCDSEVLMRTAHVTTCRDLASIIDTTKFRVRHFMTKSKEEWDYKWHERGDVGRAHFRDGDFELFNELV